MKIYINNKTNFGYGTATAIVAAENIEEAQWLTKDFETPIGSDMPLFDETGWHELKGAIPEYVITKGKVLHFSEYWE